MASPRQNYKTINVLYSHNNQQESHPVKFYNEMDINDVDFMIKETVESLKNHMNQPDLKVWCPHKGTEINYQVEPLHVYNDILISDSKPVTHHNVRSNLPVQEEPEPQPVIQPADIHMMVSRTGEGPIVRDCILKGESSQSISMDKSKEKPKSAAKSLLLSRDHSSKAENKTWETEDSKHLAQSARVQGNVNREPHNGTFEPINNQHSLANKEYMSPNTQTPVKEQVYTRPEQHDISYSPNQVNNSQAKTESLKKANPPPRMGMEEDIQATTTVLVPKRVIAKPPTGTIGTVPLDGNDPNIYSTRTSIMPFSYMITVMDQKYNEKLPPPLYLPYEVLAEKKSFAKDDVLRGLEITSVGELKLVDPEILQNQKGLIKEVLQSLMKSIAEGRGVVGVSLPIRIFEPRSLIERICDFWTFVPKRIIPAAQTTDPVIRMKKVIAMIIGGLHLSAKQTKPFNPLLGETYQAVFPDDGITIDLEHTSHHPPIANYLLTHKDFRIWGRYEFIAKLEGLTKNTVIMLQKGTCHLDFADGHKLQYWCPHLHLEGMMHGDRTAKFVGNLKIVDEKNKLKTVVKFGSSGEHKAFPKKRTDAFNGKIYRYKDGALKSKDDDLHFADLESNICDVYGSWLEYLNIGGEVEWDITRDIPTQFFPVKDPLPSDARYREDLIWIKRNNKKFGQEWKLLLEVRQRAEKKLRQDGLRARRHPTK